MKAKRQNKEVRGVVDLTSFFNITPSSSGANSMFWATWDCELSTSVRH